MWNDCLDLHWWLYDAYQVWTSASEKKQWYNATTHKLHSQTIQAIIELHEETCKRTRELRTKGKKQWRYPWKYKKFFSLNNQSFMWIRLTSFYKLGLPFWQPFFA
ncbi:hypothetical protein [Bacillus sp. X1(2014)]|uniref:hypothetical protein n=1 Tax=Bacillus sp. X1(2014) TaxID=1565991 RepID=UPI0011A287DC|nr:hypothetical protein [Bacillus sp. X1(2014)]